MRAGARPAAASNEPLQWTNWKLLSELRIVSCMHVVSGAGEEGCGVLGNRSLWHNIMTASKAATKFLGQIRGIKRKKMKRQGKDKRGVDSQLPLLQRRNCQDLLKTLLLPPSFSLVWWGVSLPALPQLLSRILPWMGTFSTKLCGETDSSTCTRSCPSLWNTFESHCSYCYQETPYLSFSVAHSLTFKMCCFQAPRPGLLSPPKITLILWRYVFQLT